jgi:hypothetical protein
MSHARKPADSSLVHLEKIQRRIHFVRGRRVMLDSDLAEFYGVGTRDLNKAVSRNDVRFPSDFAFILTPDETRHLMFQLGTSSSRHGGRRKPATVFTEQGVAMLASVLRSPRAITMSIAIVRAFVQLRELISTHQVLAGKLTELERRLEGHDSAIADLFTAIRQLLASPAPKHHRRIGFHQGNR